MNTWHYLTDPVNASLYWPGVVAGLAIAVLCSVLSVLVVLKRMAFVGQGISHAAFGGAGLATFLGLTATFASMSGGGAAQTLGQFLLVLLFCVAAALLMGWLSRRTQTEADTAIGIVLVAAMAAGSVLISKSDSSVPWESFLFGDILSVSWDFTAIGWTVAAIVLGALWASRRRLMFWAFDPPAAGAWGVSDRAMNILLMTLLALATVTAMRIAGVVLATAMLVMPGAIALKLSRRWRTVCLLACFAALAGVFGGMIVSFEFDWPPGASMVCVLTLLFALAAAVERFGARR
jgi:zinc transport system permease protein